MLYPVCDVALSPRFLPDRGTAAIGGFLEYLMPNETPDGELIRRYLTEQDQSAFEALLRRHHDQVFWRFLKRVGNRADAEDLTQQMWIRVVDNLGRYDDQGKFSSFLATIGTNLLNDHWRRKGVRSAAFVDWTDDEEHSPKLDPADRRGSAEDDVVRQSAINYLVTELIPQLPCEQRMIYLLRHESEHWEENRRLDWSHMAELNGVTVNDAWSRFESMRKDLLMLTHAGEESQDESLDFSKSPRDEASDSGEKLLIFLVWTQAQRPHKDQKYTESYFAELLGVSVNTLKTRYRTATRSLARGLGEWQGRQ